MKGLWLTASAFLSAKTETRQGMATAPLPLCCTTDQTLTLIHHVFVYHLSFFDNLDGIKLVFSILFLRQIDLAGTIVETTNCFLRCV